MTRVLGPGGKLTSLERTVLWHAAQGLTTAATARALSRSVPAVQDARHRLLGKLNAASLTHAVHLAGMAGLIGQYPDCGDRAAYLRHLRRRDDPCLACRAANARHEADRRAGRLSTNPKGQAA
ncbi:LuxR C-terminal-related transcriptional regulator [Streptomyces sp. NPDC096030]|uniref:LuxR C-terminal-related transcriptional regulator n=1 Tax=Streptomyces sp. NPDC096030 TaxID=3155423 RepID=UPI00331A0C75